MTHYFTLIPLILMNLSTFYVYIGWWPFMAIAEVLKNIAVGPFFYIQLYYIILGLCSISYRGGRCILPPLVFLSFSLIFFLRYFLCVRMLASDPVQIPAPDKDVCTGMAKGQGQSEDVVWYQDLLTRLPEEVYLGTVFLLQALDSNLVIRNHGPPDAPVCGPHQIDGNPIIDLSVLP